MEKNHRNLEMRGKAQRAARPAQTNSGVTGPKFTKSLSEVEESSAVLTRQSLLRSYPLWKANAHNEGRVCQFSPIRAKIDYLINVP